ncbi:MAG: tRNA (guanosine(37)-N1)-methyltransferase TrmD [Candidatus Competibacterales bacterium]|nr:tRNA (guanosine(37)-N1)-methyltransferase TrmD [Candidatus Competibacterales bacterium]
MRIDVLTLFPSMFRALTDYGITGRACAAQRLKLALWDPRDATRDRHRSVDDRPYGGGPGMVMKVQPLRDTLQRVHQAAGARGRVIHLSPQGRPLNQAGVERLAQEPHLVLVAGRYEGIDERLVTAEVDEEYSVGDYVLSGGELAAMVLIDALTRLLPEVLGDPESARQDSFAAGLLDHPHYTRPERIDGREVPAVLLGGDHAAIRRWRLRQALGRTWLRRPELLGRLALDAEQRQLLDEFIATYRQPAVRD